MAGGYAVCLGAWNLQIVRRLSVGRLSSIEAGRGRAPKLIAIRVQGCPATRSRREQLRYLLHLRLQSDAVNGVPPRSDIRHRGRVYRRTTLHCSVGPSPVLAAVVQRLSSGTLSQGDHPQRPHITQAPSTTSR